MYKVLRRLFFLLPPEPAHRLVFRLMKIPGAKQFLSILCNYDDESLKTTIAGLKFPNPVGLAAGLDKDAEVVEALAAVGFGFIEVGTVTPLPQPGNPKPRLYRLKKDQALVNRMGFNNSGVQELKEKLKQIKHRKFLLGVNIGKNKATPLELAVDDYVFCYKELYDYCDFFVVNVSSPNTPNLRKLQNKDELRKIFAALTNVAQNKPVLRPVFLKIAPDLTNEMLDDIIELVKDMNLAGIVATNTTIERPADLKSKHKSEQGGLSGKPLKSRSTEIVEYIYKKSDGTIPVIGVGGIFSADDAIEKMEKGAVAVEIFTSFIYNGPCVVKKIKKGLALHFRNKKKIDRFG